VHAQIAAEKYAVFQMAHSINLDKSKFHLLAVNVAAELSAVKVHGEAISLEAMNAKVLVARAGSMAMGFRPLTDFMVKLAEDIVHLVSEIESEALSVAHQAVTRLRTSNAVKLAEKSMALSDAQEAKYRSDLPHFVETVRNRDAATVDRLLNHAYTLTKLLDEIVEQMLAASAVSSSIRIEAAAIDERYSASFNKVSTNLHEFSSAILTTVKNNLNVLNRALNK